mgnify:CR=1 FL=1
MTTSQPRRNAIILFFMLSYAISWTAWLGMDVLWPADSPVSFLGSYGPALAALLVAATSGGRAGLADLLARLFTWRVSLLWYVIALGLSPLMAALLVGIAALAGYLGADLPSAAHWSGVILPQLPGLLLLGLIGVLVLIGEELGWRGYALPALQSRTGPLASSVILGVLWGLWHLPTLLADHMPARDIAFFVWGTTSASIIYTWLASHTRGSVLIACLFHAAFDVVGILTPLIIPFREDLAFGLGMLVLALTALAILALAGPTLHAWRTAHTPAGPA